MTDGAPTAAAPGARRPEKIFWVVIVGVIAIAAVAAALAVWKLPLWAYPDPPSVSPAATAAPAAPPQSPQPPSAGITAPATAGAPLTYDQILRARHDVRQATIAAIVALTGIGTVAGLIFTAYFALLNLDIATHNASLAARTAADAHTLGEKAAQTARAALKTSKATLDLQIDALVTDRFGKAVEHLAETSQSQRLGAIHALARIARRSPADHWPIMQILTAELRE